MTLAEQREKLVEIIDEAIDGQWMPDALLHAISAAGFSIVGPEVTEEMLDAWWSMSDDAPISEFKAMLAAGDLARKPE